MDGKRVLLRYRQFSADDLKAALDRLMKKRNAQEIDAFFSVLGTYVGILEKDIRK